MSATDELSEDSKHHPPKMLSRLICYLVVGIRLNWTRSPADGASDHSMSKPHLMTVLPAAIEIFQSGPMTLTSTEPMIDGFLITTLNNNMNI